MTNLGSPPGGLTSYGRAIALQLDHRFLSLLNHPARIRMLMVLERGPASTRELAALVDLRPSAMNYHVNKLLADGLIEQVDSSKERAFMARIWRAQSSGWTEVERDLAKVVARAQALPRLVSVEDHQIKADSDQIS